MNSLLKIVKESGINFSGSNNKPYELYEPYELDEPYEPNEPKEPYEPYELDEPNEPYKRYKRNPLAKIFILIMFENKGLGVRC